MDEAVLGGRSDQDPSKARPLEGRADLDPLESLFLRSKEGDREARDALLELVHDELLQLARSNMRGLTQGHTLQPTALVNEVYLRLTRAQEGWNDRGHLLALAARAMRQVLVDHVRAKRSEKRSPAGERVALDALVESYEERSVDLLALDEALHRLAAQDALAARLIELRFFAGESVEDCARSVGVPAHRVYRILRSARALLHLYVTGEEEK